MASGQAGPRGTSNLGRIPMRCGNSPCPGTDTPLTGISQEAHRQPAPSWVKPPTLMTAQSLSTLSPPLHSGERDGSGPWERSITGLDLSVSPRCPGTEHPWPRGLGHSHLDTAASPPQTSVPVTVQTPQQTLYMMSGRVHVAFIHVRESP